MFRCSHKSVSSRTSQGFSRNFKHKILLLYSNCEGFRVTFPLCFFSSYLSRTKSKKCKNSLRAPTHGYKMQNDALRRNCVTAIKPGMFCLTHASLPGAVFLNSLVKLIEKLKGGRRGETETSIMITLCSNLSLYFISLTIKISRISNTNEINHFILEIVNSFICGTDRAERVVVQYLTFHLYARLCVTARCTFQS